MAGDFNLTPACSDVQKLVRTPNLSVLDKADLNKAAGICSGEVQNLFALNKPSTERTAQIESDLNALQRASVKTDNKEPLFAAVLPIMTGANHHVNRIDFNTEIEKNGVAKTTGVGFDRLSDEKTDPFSITNGKINF